MALIRVVVEDGLDDDGLDLALVEEHRGIVGYVVGGREVDSVGLSVLEVVEGEVGELVMASGVVGDVLGGNLIIG